MFLGIMDFSFPSPFEIFGYVIVMLLPFMLFVLLVYLVFLILGQINIKKSDKNTKNIIKIIGVIIIAFFGMALIYYANYDRIEQEKKYKEAKKLMNEEKYLEANKLLVRIKRYKDSKVLLDECSKELEIVEEESSTNANEKNEGTTINKEIAYEVKDLYLEELNIGDVVNFGMFKKFPIPWTIIDMKDGKILLIEKAYLRKGIFIKDNEPLSWKDSTIRNYLNDKFLNDTFDRNEQNLILETNIENSNNNEYGLNLGENTVDKIFILSEEETKKYFNVNNFNYDSASNKIWLRSVDRYERNAKTYKIYNNKLDLGSSLMHNNCCIRPALWIKLR